MDFSWLLCLAMLSSVLALGHFNSERSTVPLPGAVEVQDAASEDFLAVRSASLDAVFGNALLDNLMLSDADIGMTIPDGIISQMENGVLYVYTTDASSEYISIKNAAGGSGAIGTSDGGVFDNGLGSTQTLPAFVPEGAVISMIRIR